MSQSLDATTTKKLGRTYLLAFRFILLRVPYFQLNGYSISREAAVR